MFLLLLLCLCAPLLVTGEVYGYFDLYLTNFKNNGGHDYTGDICDYWPANTACDTYFQVCLGTAYSSTQNGFSCNYVGWATSSRWDDKDTFSPNYKFTLSFTQPWIVPQNFRLDAYDYDSSNSDDLIQWSAYQQSVSAGTGWTALNTYSFSIGAFTFQTQVRCATNRYGPTCSIYCLPNSGGSYTCDSDGNKICSDGYYGSNCDVVCPVGYVCVAGVKTACVAGTTYQDLTTQGSCKTTKTCNAGTYISTAATISSDRVCTACNGVTGYSTSSNQNACSVVSVCGVGTYVTLDPSAVNDRTCAPCSNTYYQDLTNQPTCKVVKTCYAGTYVSVNSTKSSDATCKACNGTYQYTDLLNQYSCRAVANCTGGTYIKTNSTFTSNRICDSCLPSVTYQDVPNLYSCKKVSVCSAGTFQSSAATLAADKICTACDGIDYYQNATDQLSCKRVTDCLPGQYISVPASPMTDRTCQACGFNTYQDLGNQASCKAVSECSAGLTYQVQAPTPSTNRICGSCSGCPSGRTKTVDCTLLQDTQCNGCASCTTGTYQSSGCTATTDTVCLPCASCTLGVSFQFSACNSLSNTVCKVCSACSSDEYRSKDCSLLADVECTALTICHSDQYETVPSTPTSDRTCSPLTVCSNTQFESVPPTATTNRVCSPLSVCSAGNAQSVPPTATTNRMCAPCGSSEYQPQSGQEGCLPLSSCSVGKEQTISPTPTTDRVCGVCQASTYQDQVGQLACKNATICAAGKRISVLYTPTTDTVCASCGPGTFQNEANQATCKNCGLGYYQGGIAKTSCTVIQAGQYGTGGSEVTRTGTAPCPAGYMCPGGDSAPITCVNGTSYQTATGASTCKSCKSCFLGFTRITRCNFLADTVCKDIAPPVLTLLGDLSLVVAWNSTFVDPGAVASDTADGNITSRVDVEGVVDTGDLNGGKPYVLTYVVTDKAGNLVSAYRNVTVSATTPDASTANSASINGGVVAGVVVVLIIIVLLVLIIVVMRRRQPKRVSQQPNFPSQLALRHSLQISNPLYDGEEAFRPAFFAYEGVEFYTHVVKPSGEKVFIKVASPQEALSSGLPLYTKSSSRPSGIENPFYQDGEFYQPFDPSRSNQYSELPIQPPHSSESFYSDVPNPDANGFVGEDYLYCAFNSKLDGGALADDQFYLKVEGQDDMYTEVSPSNINQDNDHMFLKLDRTLFDSCLVHPDMTREESEALLAKYGNINGLYLVRAHSNDEFVLSVSSGGVVSHHLITKNEQGQFFVNELPHKATSLSAVIKSLEKPSIYLEQLLFHPVLSQKASSRQQLRPRKPSTNFYGTVSPSENQQRPENNYYMGLAGKNQAQNSYESSPTYTSLNPGTRVSDMMNNTRENYLDIGGNYE